MKDIPQDGCVRVAFAGTPPGPRLWSGVLVVVLISVCCGCCASCSLLKQTPSTNDPEQSAVPLPDQSPEHRDSAQTGLRDPSFSLPEG